MALPPAHMPDQPILGRMMILGASLDAVRPYLAAARRVNVAAVLGLDESVTPSAPGLIAEVLPLQLATRDSALAVAQYAFAHPLVAVLAADERSAPSAARAASMLGLAGHAPKACDACLDKFRLRQKLSNAGFPVPLLGGDSAPAADLIALLDDGRMRVLATRSGSDPAELPRAALETVWRAARLLLLRQGPIYARLALAGENQLLDLSPAIPTAFLESLRFRLPLVEEDMSLAEVITRHTLKLDISRIHPLPPSRP